MDAQAILELFAATLDPAEQTRQQAERALGQAESQAGFLGSCLSIVLEPDIQTGIKVAASVYLKNRIQRGWSPDRARQLEVSPIPDLDKPEFRTRIVPAIAQASPQIRQILVPVILTIVNHDYPDDWLELLPSIRELLNQQDAHAVYTGLSIFLQLCRHYRWNSKEVLSKFDAVAEEIYPQVLSIGERLVGESSHMAGLMMYDVMKIYKMIAARQLPPVVQNSEVAQRTVALFLQTIIKPISAEVMALESWSEREQNPWLKAKKWASFNILRTHTKYLSVRSTSLSSGVKDLTNYRKHYLATFTPEIVNVYLDHLQTWIRGEIWIPHSTLYNIIAFLEASVDHKSAWKQLEPHFHGMVTHVIYPLLCPNMDDLELFEDDPVEFVHKCIEVYPETVTVDVAATNFLSTLVRKGKQTALGFVLLFLHKRLTDLAEEPMEVAIAAQKVGALRILQTMAPAIMMKNSPCQDQIEAFLEEYVLPDLANSAVHPILRARACQLINAVANVHFKNRYTLQAIYNATLQCFYDENLPLQVEASLTLQALSDHPDVRAALGGNIAQIVQHLLNLSKKIDLDSLMAVMDEFVDMYPEQITPFAVQMAQQLRDQFLSLASELHEYNMQDPNKFSLIAEDKTTAGVGMLKTLTGLESSLEHHPELIQELEQVVLPIFDAVYRHHLTDFYTETYYLHENTLFTRKTVSPEQWQLFPLALEAQKQVQYSYIEDAMPLLENYVAFGAGHLAQSPQDLGLLVELVSGLVDKSNDYKIPVDELTLTLKLGIRLLETPELLHSGAMHQFLEPLLVHTLDRMVLEKASLPKMKRYTVNLIGLVLGALVNHAGLTFQVLESKSLTDPFFALWTQSMIHFDRLDDLKLELLVLLALLQLQDSELPTGVQQLLPQLVDALAHVLNALPEAIARHEELAKAADEHDFGDIDDQWADADFYQDEEDEDEDDNAVDTTEDTTVGSMDNGPTLSAGNSEELTDFLNSKFHYYDSGDFDEDVYTISPLESMNPSVVLKEQINQLSQKPEQFARYQQLLATIPEQQRGVIEAALLQG
ncbi:hypothetical protein B9G98_03228 [Wickerhamiella sorbophila]|uniref:Importin N-terminal domain-containing protein n=1 Tax=Wickerhamiella sorbophila TaxID=45607 RepID=A0A2T0FKU5_9ASCO|nr:hypothetical protein B9G98_03228 [Wickerhamiella sorbophila]PRT55608.1 hypothetical protein B9G98_03228 [Wickerhamiella sorbophila]